MGPAGRPPNGRTRSQPDREDAVIPDIAWAVFAFVALTVGLSLLLDVARQLQGRRRRWTVGDGEAGEFASLTSYRQARACVYNQPGRKSCYMQPCPPGCALFTEALPAGDAARPRRRLSCIAP